MIGFYNYTVILTYIGAVCGAFGLAFAFDSNIFAATVCLMLAGICDMFDGTVAGTRKRTDAERRFGIWIDSLSDVICFGVLPAVIGYASGMKAFYYIFVLAVFVLAAIIRLAYYGVTEVDRQRSGAGPREFYDGLPVTSSALIFPLLFCFRSLLGTYYAPVYSLVLAVTALLFISKFKLKKLHMAGMLVLAALGIAIFIAVLLTGEL